MPLIICDSISAAQWACIQPTPSSLTDSLHIWRIDIEASMHLMDKCSLVLNADEQQRARKYYHQKDRSRFILARGILRRLLAGYSAREAGDITFLTGDNKKPYMAPSGQTEIHYNVSHAGNLILIAVGHDAVGIDVSYADPGFDYADIMHLCFSDAEAAFIQSCPNPLQTFHLLWSRKEALLKATGKGIDNDLKLIPCLDGSHMAPASVVGAVEDMVVHSFEVCDSYAGSLAVAKLVEQIKFMDVSDFALEF